MISLNQRIQALAQLGIWLSGYIDRKNQPNGNIPEQWRKLDDIVGKQHIYNQWLIEPFVLKEIQRWADRLTLTSLVKFASLLSLKDSVLKPADVAVIPPQNIPMAGFHDVICIWMTGHRFCGTLSHETELIFAISQQLLTIEPEFETLITWSDTFPKSAQAFLVHQKQEENPALLKYFSARKSLIRTRAFSAAVIFPGFSAAQFQALTGDIMDYFGYSAHNIRKLFVSRDFSLEDFFPPFEAYAWTKNVNRYANNYDYQRSVFLLDRIPFFENGFLILRESNALTIPIGCVYFEYFDDETDLFTKLNEGQYFQITSNQLFQDGVLMPGEAHHYPIRVFDNHLNTIDFLKSLKE